MWKTTIDGQPTGAQDFTDPKLDSRFGGDRHPRRAAQSGFRDAKFVLHERGETRLD
jgi:hypothetical protein